MERRHYERFYKTTLALLIVLIPTLLFLAGYASANNLQYLTNNPLPTPTQTMSEIVESMFHTAGSSTPITFLNNCITVFGAGTPILADPLNSNTVIHTVQNNEHIEVFNGSIDQKRVPNMMIVTGRDLKNKGHVAFIPLHNFTDYPTSEDGCKLTEGKVFYVETLGDSGTAGIIQVIDDKNEVIPVGREAILPGPFNK